MKPVVSFVTVAYKTPDLIEVLLSGVEKVGFSFPFEYILVNNNPGDGLEELIRTRFPWVIYIDAPGNVGFGAGNNVGFQRATGEFVMCTNPDLTFFAGQMERLIAAARQDAQVGIWAPKLLNPNGTLQRNFHRFPNILIPVFRRTPLGKTRWGQKALAQYHMEDQNGESAMDVDGLFGAALLIRKEVLDLVGGFDERYFMYLEDVDLCRRFWKQGFRVRYDPSATFVHYHQRESAIRYPWELFTRRQVRAHVVSAMKYFWKYRSETVHRDGNRAY